jgi:hypothetical protein
VHPRQPLYHHLLLQAPFPHSLLLEVRVKQEVIRRVDLLPPWPLLHGLQRFLLLSLPVLR